MLPTRLLVRLLQPLLGLLLLAGLSAGMAPAGHDGARVGERAAASQWQQRERSLAFATLEAKQASKPRLGGLRGPAPLLACGAPPLPAPPGTDRCLGRPASASPAGSGRDGLPPATGPPALA